MTPDDFARGCIDRAWTADHRFGLLSTTLRRPGRGQSTGSTNRAGRRIEDRPAVLAEFDRLAAKIVVGLRAGTLAAEEARAMVEAAGFSEALRVAELPGEMADRLASVVLAGDNVWVDCSPDDGVLHLRFWADPSHPRIA